MDSSPDTAPLIWRFLLALARAVVAPLCRLQVTGSVPAHLHGAPLILAANHLSPFDPVVVAVACRRIGLTPRFMATAGLFRTPVIGSVMRACGHIRVDRNTTRVADALPAAARALQDGATILLYPEGRIGLDPWMWPERGKTGAARMAAASGATIIPVAQWNTHAVLPYSAPRGMLPFLWRALRTRPVVQVRFGPPVDLSTVTGPAGPQAMQATALIMDAIDAALTPLRAGEMQTPHLTDHTRPNDDSRIRPRPGRDLPATAPPA